LVSSDFTYNFTNTIDMVYHKKKKLMDKKEEKLREIDKLLETYGKDGLEIDPYVLKYLSLSELENIELLILTKQSDVITDNSDWLQHFKKEI
jgi:hypothetical protein